MNKKLLKLLKGDESKYPKFIEANYPHIIEKLLEYWGTAQMPLYFEELMMSKRGINRQGFPAEVTAEIWTLNSFYEALYPNTVKGLGTDVWLLDQDAARSNWKESYFHKKAEDDKS
jgi:hypothetical protein